MVRIDPDTLYSRSDLREILDPLGIDPDFFVQRIRPRKVFKQAFLGADLLEAIKTADPLGSTEKALPPAKNKGGRKTKRIGGFDPGEVGL